MNTMNVNKINVNIDEESWVNANILQLHLSTLPFDSTILLKILIQSHCTVTGDEEVPKGEKCQALD